MAKNMNNEKQIKDPPASFLPKVWTHFGFFKTDDGRTLVRSLSPSARGGPSSVRPPAPRRQPGDRRTNARSSTSAGGVLFLTRRPRQPTNTCYKADNIENEYSGAVPLFHRLERTLSCLDTLKCMNINNMSYVNQDSAF